MMVSLINGYQQMNLDFRKTVFLILRLFTNDLFVSGFQIFEMGTGIIGTVVIGQATTIDTSSSYFTSAVMTTT